MKIDNIENYKNENGEIDYEKLNEDIMAETNKSFNKGLEKAKKEIKTQEPKQEEIKKEEKKGDSSNEELKALLKRIDELENSTKEEKNNRLMSSFKSNAKKKGLSDEQIDFYANSMKVESLSDFNFDLVARKEVPDVGEPTKVPENTNKTDKQEKKDIIKQARELRQ